MALDRPDTRPSPAVIRYRWQCLICGTGCEGGLYRCSQCGFPARATGREIAEARRVLADEAPRPRPKAAHDGSWIQEIWIVLAPLSVWRKAVMLAGVGAFVGGGFVLKIAWSLSVMGWAGGIAIAGLAAVALASAGAGPRRGGTRSWVKSRDESS